MSEREQLIAALSRDVPSVKPVRNIDHTALLWMLLSAAYVVAITHLFGPIRPNALAQLASTPRFLGELLCGLAAIAVMAVVGFRAAIPGALTPRLATLGGVLVTVWVGCYVFGLVNPALEPSMLGKRPHCVWETFVYALPPVLLGFALTRRLFPLQPVKAALAFSLAAGLMPALYMQIACMYAPDHILKFHILPGLLMGALGASAAAAWWRDPSRV